MDAKQMGIRIKQVRLEKGLVQKDIADQVGVAISQNPGADAPGLVDDETAMRCRTLQDARTL